MLAGRRLCGVPPLRAARAVPRIAPNVRLGAARLSFRFGDAAGRASSITTSDAIQGNPAKVRERRAFRQLQ
jgi:hypothetical protein